MGGFLKMQKLIEIVYIARNFLQLMYLKWRSL